MKTFILIIAVISLCTLSHQACPDESELTCSSMTPADCIAGASNLVNRYINVDGEECSVCAVCVTSLEECPWLACPMTALPAGCNSPKLYGLYTKVNGKKCKACDTIKC